MKRDVEILGPELKIGLAGRHELFLRNLGDGRVFRHPDHEAPIKNVITDVGLDSCFARSFCHSRANLVLGTGTTAASTTDTTLANYYAISTTYSATENGVLVDSTNKYVEDWRMHTWTNSTGSDKTIYELGLSWLATANPTVFSRIVLSAGVTIPNGYELIDKYILRKYIPDWRTVTTPSITVNGISQSGRAMLIGNNTYASDTTLNMTASSAAMSKFETTGEILEPSIFSGCPVCEPSSVVSSNFHRAALFTSSTAYASMTATDDFTQPTLYSYDGLTLGTYTAGSFTNTKYYSFLASTLPGQTFYGFQIGTGSGYPHFVFRADAPFTKNATSTYHIGLRTTLARA